MRRFRSGSLIVLALGTLVVVGLALMATVQLKTAQSNTILSRIKEAVERRVLTNIVLQLGADLKQAPGAKAALYHCSAAGSAVSLKSLGGFATGPNATLSCFAIDGYHYVLTLTEAAPALAARTITAVVQVFGFPSSVSGGSSGTGCCHAFPPYNYQANFIRCPGYPNATMIANTTCSSCHACNFTHDGGYAMIGYVPMHHPWACSWAFACVSSALP